MEGGGPGVVCGGEKEGVVRGEGEGDEEEGDKGEGRIWDLAWPKGKMADFKLWGERWGERGGGGGNDGEGRIKNSFTCYALDFACVLICLSKKHRYTYIDMPISPGIIEIIG